MHDAPPDAQGTGDGASPFRWDGSILLIGASTGGVEALVHILRSFPADCPPTVIVQHMPEGFLSNFAQRLDAIIAPIARLASDGAALRRGEVLIAPGGEQHLHLVGTVRIHTALIAGERRNGHRPSVDVTFESAVPAAASVVAALLTGMGRDGADGMLALRAAGARTLAQDQASSVVWGMPGAAWANGAAAELVGRDRMGGRLLALSSRGPSMERGAAGAAGAMADDGSGASRSAPAGAATGAAPKASVAALLVSGDAGGQGGFGVAPPDPASSGAAADAKAAAWAAPGSREVWVNRGIIADVAGGDSAPSENRSNGDGHADRSSDTGRASGPQEPTERPASQSPRLLDGGRPTEATPPVARRAWYDWEARHRG